MRYAVLFFGQGLNFLIAILNIRAASKGYIKLTMATDFVFCLVSYGLIRRIADAGSTGELLAYASGGAVGSMLAIMVSRKWDK